ncbi:hypothetical protein JOF56_009949 [Kibdelosporangium banguiense]|uniref:Uncharacterized protein n=1 Tax=Kibdelosporangium banguiense TaxID=1365924 RepID=A0ABS4TYT4_9PSEU|nr:hypothetical protein [Kibdelosporangium banguiense]
MLAGTLNSSTDATGRGEGVKCARGAQGGAHFTPAPAKGWKEGHETLRIRQPAVVGAGLGQVRTGLRGGSLVMSVGR